MSVVSPTIHQSSRVLLAPSMPSASTLDSSAAGQWPLIPLPYTPIVKTLAEDIPGMLAIDMSLIHNVFIRGLNSVWKNAPLVKPGDESAFAGYCLALIDSIHAHHHGEETLIFPYLQTKLEMNENIEQHKIFHDGMDAFEGYMKQVFSNKGIYDQEKARDLLKAFADPLVSHLHAEIATISPEKMQVFQDEDPEGLKNMMHQLEEHIKTLPGKLITFPFAMTHHDFDVAPNWPPAPRPLIWFARNIAPWRHSSYWKFSPFKPRGGVNVYA